MSVQATVVAAAQLGAYQRSLPAVSQRPVLEVRVSRLVPPPPLTAVCPGYEQRAWRDEALARDTFDRHLPSFALPYSVRSAINETTAAALLRRAAKAVYATDKYSKRGEFGELLLHAICRDIFGSHPAISKITFKDAANDTVKGFDSVHVIEAGERLELWLGEVKFYDNLTKAIYDVTSELALHLKGDYLRAEFVPVVNKLDPSWPHTPRIERLLDENASLDEVFDVLTIPVLCTYDSKAVGDHDSVCAAYIAQLTAEAEDAWANFTSKCDPLWDVQLRLILLPLLSKSRLVELMQKRLLAWQQI
jgi:hypothetical protein